MAKTGTQPGNAIAGHCPPAIFKGLRIECVAEGAVFAHEGFCLILEEMRLLPVFEAHLHGIPKVVFASVVVFVRALGQQDRARFKIGKAVGDLVQQTDQRDFLPKASHLSPFSQVSPALTASIAQFHQGREYGRMR